MTAQTSSKDLFDAQNPLICPPSRPLGAPAFDLVHTEHFLPAIRWGIAKAKEEIEELKKAPSPGDFSSIIEPLERAGEDVGRISAVFSAYTSSLSNDEIRSLEEIIDCEMAMYYTDISLDEDLFLRIKEVYDSCDRRSLDTEQKVLLEESYKGFVRGGALLSISDKAIMREINEKLAQTTTQYSNHIVKATEAYKKHIENETDLDGVPDRAKALYQHIAREAGLETGYLITLEPYPIDIMTHCSNRSLREEIHRALATRAFKDENDNLALVRDLVTLRHKRARLLGFDCHADYILADRMAGSTKTVIAFLEKNLASYKPAAERELAEIKDLAKQLGRIDPLKPWDLAYYARLLKEQTFHLELETLRPYFNLEKVLLGLQKHAEKLFQIEMREENTGKYPVYHPDVKTYEIYDNATQKLIGLFYADYYARPGAKRGGAWMNAFRDRSEHDGRIHLPLVINNCNFPKPTAEQPTFLSLGDVETVFHEFGHGLHALLTTARYASLAGANVKWDFVELPSQVQERWIIQKEVLDTFAHHHETGAPLPDQLIETIQAMQNFDAGMAGLTQTFYAMLDMAYYANHEGLTEDPEQLEKRIADRTTLLPREAGLMSTSFSHIFSGGYSAGYYSYKWAEVLDADVFAAFKKHGLYDPELSRKLRTLYAKGGTQPPMEIFVEMMGREPDATALFELSGIAPVHTGTA